MPTVSFITGSPEKFSEAKLVIPDLAHVAFDLPEIQELDQKKIIDIKLQAARSQGLKNIIVEDTGLYFKSLNYALPGPLVKWFVKSLGNPGLLLLSQIDGKSNQAFAYTTIGYIGADSEQCHFFEGRVDGTIVPERGSGFGWDTIFQPDGIQLTLGEMTLEHKTSLSHRGKAFKALAQYLSSQQFPLL